MLLKCCTQYVRKFGKLSRGHRTGKGQSSFQSQRNLMPKNVQTTVQLHSFYMLLLAIPGLCSKSFKLHFSNSEPRTSRCTNWVEKRQRTQISNYQHSLGHGENKSSRKASTSASLIILKALTMDNS